MAESVNMKTQLHIPLSPSRSRWYLELAPEERTYHRAKLEIFHLTRKLLPMNMTNSGHREYLAPFVKLPR